jgi:hypothetical protein
MTRETASREELLNRLYDGELEGAEAEALRATLSDEEEQALAALADLGALVRNSVTAEANEQPLDLWAAIEEKLGQGRDGQPPEEKDSEPQGKVLPMRRKLGLRISAVVTALAAAASLLLWMRPLPVSNRCDVEELEVAGSNAMVLTVPDDRGDTTTVIWFEHQQDDEWETL